MTKKAVQPKRYKREREKGKSVLCSMAEEDIFTELRKRREFNNIIITVRDNCLDTK